MKVTFRIPSKAIQYGYVETEFELPNDESASMLAQRYLSVVSDFQMSEMDIVKAKQESVRAPIPEPVDVATPQGGDDKVLSKAPDEGSEDVDEASKTLAEGLGAVTLVDDEVAPWDKPTENKQNSNPWDDVPEFDFS